MNRDLMKAIAYSLGMPTGCTADELRERVEDIAGDGLMGVEEQKEFYDRINEAEGKPCHTELA